MKRLTKDSLTSRILAFTLTVIVAVGTIPATSFVSKALAVMAGDVEAISEGLTVDDTSIGNVQVTHTGTTTLEWADVDESLGRMEAGWWAGINVTAPNSLDETELEAVKLQKRDGTESAWSSDILFKDVRDEEDKVALWTLITEAKANAGEDIVRQWQFDWDADGNYDQTITITLKPENLLLTKDGAQVFPKLGKVEHLNGGGVSAVAGNETSQTTVTVNEMQLTWSDVDAAAGKDEAGWWTEIKVSAPVGMDAAQLENAKYQSQAGVKEFWTDKDSDDGAAEHYIKLGVRLNAAIVNEAEEKGENISTIWQFDWDGNGVYDQTVTYVIVPSDSIELVKENQAVLNINNLPNVLVYGNTTYTVEVTGGSGNGAVSYSIENEKDILGQDADVANVDATGKVTLVRAGSFTLKVTKAGDDVYNAATPVTKTVTVQLATQTGFAFETVSPEPITYNDNGNKFTNLAVGGQSTKDVVYEITEGALYADINAATGELTIKKSGTVTVKATRPADDRYNAITTTYTVQIKKAKQEIAFDTAGNVDITYGATSYTNAATETSVKYNDQTIMYSVTEGADIASVDATGIVTFNDTKVGTVVVKATKAGDDCYEEATATYTLKVAYLATPSAAPVVSGDQKDANSGWYTGNVKITAPDGYTISYSNKLTGNVWDSYVEYDVEGTKDAKIYLKDAQGGITDVITVAGIKYDETLPTNLKISYRTTLWNRVLQFLSFGIYDAPLQVTLTAEDGVSGNKEFIYTYGETTKTVAVNGTSYTFDIASKFRGKISFHVKDVAGNETADIVAKDDLGNEQVIIVDEDAPVLTTNHVFSANTDTVDNITYTQDAVTLNFEVVDLAFDVYEVKPVLTINGDVKTATWIDSEGKGTLTYELPYEEGQYVVQLTYTDITGKVMPAYEETIYVDKNQAVISVDDAISADKGTVYFANDKVVQIEIKEPNFKAELLSVNVSTSNPLNANETYTDYASYLKTQSNWSLKDNTTDTYVASIILDKDAEYVLELDYVDYARRDAVDYKSAKVVIDHKPAEITVTYDNNDVQNGKYYKADRTATIVIDEHNFDAKDAVLELSAIANNGQALEIEVGGQKVDFAEYYKALLVDNTKWTHNGNVHTIQIPFTWDADYEWSLKYTDLAGIPEKEAYPATGSDVFTVDKIAPVITVTYDNNEVKNGKYYKADRTATIIINEHNFDENNIDVQDTLLMITAIANNGQALEIEVGGQKVDFVEYYKALLVDNTKWTHNGDVHTIQIPFTSDADYEWSLKYTDLAGNVESTQNDVFTVDKIDPKMTIEYANKVVTQPLYEGREYLDVAEDGVVSATITITEHNFDAKDVSVKVVAKNSADADIMGESKTLEDEYLASFKDNKKWTHDGDVHTAIVEFKQDANYTFDVEFEDLAGNDVEFLDLAGNSIDDMTPHEFTIDRQAPTDLKIDYSKDNNKSSGYYNDQVKVTISAKDEISGIRKFDYQYLLAADVSNVNAGGQGVFDLADGAEIKQEGTTFTAEVYIPKEALNAKNQFNGTVNFTAADWNANQTATVGTDKIVVDNIKPIGKVTYNTPVKEANGISYYSGDIVGTIVINEANFFAQDAKVVVTRDGAEIPVSVKWVDNDVDTHTGTFTLTENGDYFVTVNYKDRSTNEMATYLSNELTLDKDAPVVSVTKIKANTANKDEKYGFTITVSDTNFDATTFKPSLTAVVRAEDGKYSIKTISLGNMTTVEEGKTYSYTVDNLEADGIYTLTSSVKDMADNSYTKLRLSDGTEHDTVRFSINRDGSTFAVDGNTNKLVEQYYVYKVKNDVVIEEINTDPIETYTVKVNGKVLTESEYSTTISNVDGEWYKRTYTIRKDLFKGEGEYNIVVESTDKAGTVAYSDVKNLKISFVVDQTAPVLTISGVENKGRYQTNEQTVTVIPTDDGGRLNSFKAIVFDRDGKEIGVRFEMSGEELIKYLEDNDGKITFTIPEGLENKVRIVCTDCAMNEDGITNEFDTTFEKVTVSQSKLIIFYANKPLFYGSIAAILAVVGGTIFFVVGKKRKKTEA